MPARFLRCQRNIRAFHGTLHTGEHFLILRFFPDTGEEIPDRAHIPSAMAAQISCLARALTSISWGFWPKRQTRIQFSLNLDLISAEMVNNKIFTTKKAAAPMCNSKTCTFKTAYPNTTTSYHTNSKKSTTLTLLAKLLMEVLLASLTERPSN